jgi:hypothetical protein
VSNITTALTGTAVNPGDYVSSGWAISMPGKHPAATIDVTNIVATIPMACEVDGQHTQLLNLVVHVPHTQLTIAAGDAAWHPTASAANATGYQAKILVGELCQGGALKPHGKATYTAKLVSTDTKDAFAVRFHTVDARTNVAKGKPNPNTDCASATQNKTGVAPCNAAWTPQTTSFATAPVSTTGGGTGTGSGAGGATGVVNGVTGTVAGLVGAIIMPPPVLSLHSVRHHRTTGAAAHGSTATPSQQTGGVSGATTQPAPILILPAPSQSAVLGPVPLPVPVIDSVAAGVGGALPWKWFLLLAILDIGLIVGIVIRRRLAQHDRLNAR